jgi:sec-independent protein translocase protein TatA
MPEFLGSWEFIILALLVLVLFGGKRLPEAARGLGRSLRIFKAETKGLRSDSDAEITPTPLSSTEVPPPVTGAPGTMPVVPTPPAEQQRPASQ